MLGSTLCLQVMVGARAALKDRVNGISARVSLTPATGTATPTAGELCAEGQTYARTDDVPMVQNLTCANGAGVTGRYVQVIKIGGRMDITEVAIKIVGKGILQMLRDLEHNSYLSS